MTQETVVVYLYDRRAVLHLRPHTHTHTYTHTDDLLANRKKLFQFPRVIVRRKLFACSTQFIKDNCSPKAGLKINNKIDKHTK